MSHKTIPEHDDDQDPRGGPLSTAHERAGSTAAENQMASASGETGRITSYYFDMAADLARRAVATHATVDTPANGRSFLTLCGIEVRHERIDEHTPTCARCRAYVIERDAETRTAEEVFGDADPSLAVTIPDFNPTAGYTPRGGSR